MTVHFSAPAIVSLHRLHASGDHRASTACVRLEQGPEVYLATGPVHVLDAVRLAIVLDDETPIIIHIKLMGDGDFLVERIMSNGQDVGS